MTAPGTHAETLTVFSAEHLPEQATQDLLTGLLAHQVWVRFAMHDLNQRFRRSVLGPLWLTLSMGLLVAVLGFVFGQLYHQDVGKTLPFVATGLIFWGLLTTSITDGCKVFIGSEGLIRNVPLPLSAHLYQLLARNLIMWGFNMLIYFALLVFFRLPVGWAGLLFFPGFLLLVINAAWMALVAGIVSTRYRDIPQMVQSVIQVVFFVTPVFWSADLMPSRPAFVTFNPFYHLLEIARQPLLGQTASLLSWEVSIGLAVAGTAGAILLYRLTYGRIAYWV